MRYCQESRPDVFFVAHGEIRGFPSLSMKGIFLKPAICLLLFLMPIVTTSAQKPNILVARMETSMGTMVIELFKDRTPITVDNFVGLAEGTKTWKTPSGEERSEPFYDGLIFHRVIKDFMIQGGCPQGTGSGGPGYRFQDECYAGSVVPLEGVIGDGERAGQVFDQLILPHLRDNDGTSPIPEIAALFGEMQSSQSYQPLLGKKVDGLQALLGSTEKLTWFEKELIPIKGAIKDEYTANTVFQKVLVPHLQAHQGSSPVPEIEELYGKIQEMNSLLPLVGKTIEELQALVGSQAALNQPNLLGTVDYGTLCMANSGPGTNGSQFFVVTKKDGAGWLNGKHTVFGRVLEGMDVAEAIQNVATSAADRPVEDVKIIRIGIERI